MIAPKRVQLAGLANTILYRFATIVGLQKMMFIN